MPTIRGNVEPIKLRFRSAAKVMVEADNGDRFFTTAGEAARACKQAENSKEWAEQWDGFLFHIHEWCKSHDDDVEAGYVAIGDSALNVLICVRSERYNFAIEDDLSDLDLELAERFPLCPAEVMQIPQQADLKTGLTDEDLCVYANGLKSPAPSDT